MPFINMPIQFRVPELPGPRDKTLLLDKGDLIVSYRPDYDKCSDDTEPEKEELKLQPFKGRPHESYIEGAFARGGSVPVERRYWKVQDLGVDPISGSPGDKPLHRVRIVFDGKEFSKDIVNCQNDNQVRALYEAFVAQGVVVLQLRLAVDSSGKTSDSTLLFLKLEYLPR